MFARVLLWQLASRLAVETLFWSARRADRGGEWPYLFVGAVFVSGPLAIGVLFSLPWWILTGHGPGIRMLRYEIGPAQRIGSRSRSEARPGRPSAPGRG